MPVIAKFKLYEATDTTGYHAPGKNLKFHVVMATGIDEYDENTSFFNSTPTGQIELGCVNPKANEQFEIGKEYYVTFEPAA